MAVRILQVVGGMNRGGTETRLMRPATISGSGPGRPRPAASSVLLLQLVPLMASLVMLAAYWSMARPPDFVVWLFCVIFTVHFGWGFWSWQAATGRYIDSYSLFFASLCLFNGGHMVLWAVGLSDGCDLFERFPEETTCRTLLLVNAGVTAFHFAGLLACVFREGRRRQGPAPRSESTQREPYDVSRIRLLGVLFVAASFPLAVSQAIKSFELVADKGYMALYQQDLKTGIANWDSLLPMFLMPGVLFFYAGWHRSASARIFCWGLATAYAVTDLLLGLRNPAVMSGLSIALFHEAVVRKIPRAAIVGIGVVVLGLLPLVARVRDQKQEDRYDSIFQGIEDNPMVAVIRETGGSACTIAHTVDLVPRVRDYDYGVGYWYAALTVIPNFFGDRHMTVERGKFSNWLIWAVDPETAQRGGGLGYSVVAEAYANFSIFGPSLVLGLLGFGLAEFASWVRARPHAFRYAVEAVVLTSLPVLARAETADICRLVVWTSLVPYLFVTLTGSFRNHRRVPIESPLPCGSSAGLPKWREAV